MSKFPISLQNNCAYRIHHYFGPDNRIGSGLITCSRQEFEKPWSLTQTPCVKKVPVTFLHQTPTLTR